MDSAGRDTGRHRGPGGGPDAGADIGPDTEPGASPRIEHDDGPGSEQSDGPGSEHGDGPGTAQGGRRHNGLGAGPGGAPPAGVERVRLVAVVHGQVQGVGFRWWTRRRAEALDLAGYARNLPDGRVEVVAEGPRQACEGLLRMLRSGSSPGAVDRVAERWAGATGEATGFAEC